MYTFFIIAAFNLIDLDAVLVPVAKKEYTSLPHKIYNGNSLSLFPNNVPNTIVNTIVVNIGSNIDHKIPRYERRYFNLIPFFTSSYNRNRRFQNVFTCFLLILIL